MTGSPEREQAEAWPVEPPAGTRVNDTLAWYAGQYKAALAAVSRLVERAEKAERERDEAVNDQKVTQRWVEIWTEKWQQANRQACEQRDRAHAAVGRERELTQTLATAREIIADFVAAKADEALAGGVSAAGRPLDDYVKLTCICPGPCVIPGHPGGGTAAVAQALRDECAKLIAAKVDLFLESGSLPPLWPWWLPLVDAIAERLAPAKAVSDLVAALAAAVSRLEAERDERAEDAARLLEELARNGRWAREALAGGVSAAGRPLEPFDPGTFDNAVETVEARDEFLRGVIAELQPDNGRWPGLWTRIYSLLAERDSLAAAVSRLEAALADSGGEAAWEPDPRSHPDWFGDDPAAPEVLPEETPRP